MFDWLFDMQADGEVTHVALALRSAWGGVGAIAFIGVAAGFAYWLYRRESTLPKRRRITLTALRAAALAVIALLLLEPVLAIESAITIRKNVLVLLDVSESMVATDAEGSKSREAAARAVLAEGDRSLIEAMSTDHRVRLFSFGDELADLGGTDAGLPETSADAPATRLGDALDEAVGRFSGQNIAGIVVLTDGASNHGLAPDEVARKLGERGVPVFTVGFGRPDPSDIVVEKLIAPETAFLKDRVPVRAQFRSNGFTGQAVDVVARVDGRELGRTTVELTGRTQRVELSLEPQTQVGTRSLELSIAPQPTEASSANNTISQQLRVIDEKIRVLYVEGAPRWEYRYLRQVLLRDHRLDVKFLMTLGDRELASQSSEFLPGFPVREEDLFEYDLIIVGDVPSSEFTSSQLQAIERLVRERGGSLLVLPGLQAGLASYTGTPIERVLPVEIDPAPPDAVPDSAYPSLTSAGNTSGFMQVAADERASQSSWALVQPMYVLPAIRAAKPGATVLATLPEGVRRREDYPLIAWQRYGSGKVLFVGTDQLWRLRFKRGDELHTRFWGQAIQFLTLSRLLGENKRVQIETTGREFSTGQRVPIYANVLSESFEPSRVANYTVRVQSSTGETQAVTLLSAGDVGGLYQGAFLPEHEGTYEVLPPESDADAGNSATFTAKAITLEGIEPAMQLDDLTRIAELSGGRYFAPPDAHRIADLLSADTRTALVRQEKELWQHPLVFVVVFALVGAEWLIRRRSDLV